MHQIRSIAGTDVADGFSKVESAPRRDANLQIGFVRFEVEIGLC